MMDLGATHSWTLGGIVGSFFDLVVAYFLLCGSALVFFGSKVCNLFGLYMPCPCRGIFGYQNKDLCLHKLFVEWPLRIICYVQTLAKSRFPFDYVLSNYQASNLNVNLNEGEGEASCGSVSGIVPRNWGNRESGYDTKGKRFVHQKQRSGVRRRRRLEYGKFASVVSPESSRSVRVFPFDGNDIKNEINQSLGHVDGGEDNLQGHGVFASPTSIDMSERSWYSLQRTLSFEESKEEDASSVTKSEPKTEDKPEILVNEAKTITTLEQELEEERAACAALQLELEKERAAAASATDEAMAMILRLQKEKASLEMEAMQYQRLIEEKFAHDEDEMSVLKEILIRRERENHFLEKELEAYREMGSSRDEELEDDLRNEKQSLTIDVHVIDDKMELHEENNNGVPNSNMKEAKSYICGRELEVSGESESDDSSNETSIDTEVERLRSVEKTEREKTRLEFQEVQNLQEPLRRASLPPPSSKVRTKRRRCRSLPREEACESE